MGREDSDSLGGTDVSMVMIFIDARILEMSVWWCEGESVAKSRRCVRDRCCC